MFGMVVRTEIIDQEGLGKRLCKAFFALLSFECLPGDLVLLTKHIYYKLIYDNKSINNYNINQSIETNKNEQHSKHLNRFFSFTRRILSPIHKNQT